MKKQYLPMVLVLTCLALWSGCALQERGNDASKPDSGITGMEASSQCEFVTAGVEPQLSEDVQKQIKTLLSALIHRSEIPAEVEVSESVRAKWSDSYLEDSPVYLQKVVYQDDATVCVRICQKKEYYTLTEVRWGILEWTLEENDWKANHLIISEDYYFSGNSEELTEMVRSYLDKSRAKSPLTEEDIEQARKAAIEEQLSDSFTGHMTEEEIAFLRENISAVYDAEWEERNLPGVLLSDGAGVLDPDSHVSFENATALIACFPSEDLKEANEKLLLALPMSDESRGYVCIVWEEEDGWNARHCVFCKDPITPPER